MSNEELKEKIVEVISQKQTYGITKEFKTEDLGHGGWQAWTETTKVNNAEIADALIAAGLKFDVNYSFTATFNSAQVEREHDLERRLTIVKHKADEVIDEFIERLKEENEISLRRYGKGIGMHDIHLIADKMKLELFKQQEE